MCVFEFQTVGYKLETSKRLRHTMNPSSESNHGFTVSAFVSSRELFNAAYKQQGQPVMADKCLVTEKINQLTFPFFDLSDNKLDYFNMSCPKVHCVIEGSVYV